jgi:hypothetical protein
VHGKILSGISDFSTAKRASLARSFHAIAVDLKSAANPDLRHSSDPFFGCERTSDLRMNHVSG